MGSVSVITRQSVIFIIILLQKYHLDGTVTYEVDKLDQDLLVVTYLLSFLFHSTTSDDPDESDGSVADGGLPAAFRAEPASARSGIAFDEIELRTSPLHPTSCIIVDCL